MRDEIGGQIEDLRLHIDCCAGPHEFAMLHPHDAAYPSPLWPKPDANGIYWLTQQEAQAVCFMPGMKVLHDGN